MSSYDSSSDVKDSLFGQGGAKAGGLIDFGQRSLLVSALSICFNPLFWNIVARQEYRNKVLTKAFGGNSRMGCYALAATIFSLGIFRDILYERALRAQPTYAPLQNMTTELTAYSFLVVGNVLVLSSMWALGLTGTYLGDYFGILMDDRVTAFPFNVTDAPMYYGSTLSFLGTALLYARPAGLLLTALVFTVYKIALSFEEFVPYHVIFSPFTAGIYAKRERERQAGGKKIT